MEKSSTRLEATMPSRSLRRAERTSERDLACSSEFSELLGAGVIVGVRELCAVDGVDGLDGALPSVSQACLLAAMPFGLPTPSMLKESVSFDVEGEEASDWPAASALIDKDANRRSSSSLCPASEQKAMYRSTILV